MSHCRTGNFLIFYYQPAFICFYTIWDLAHLNYGFDLTTFKGVPWRFSSDRSIVYNLKIHVSRFKTLKKSLANCCILYKDFFHGLQAWKRCTVHCARARAHAILLTVNGWAGFLSRISQDSRTEFFMAAFTLKLVAKTAAQKYKTNKHEYDSSLSESLFWSKSNGLTCLSFS